MIIHTESIQSLYESINLIDLFIQMCRPTADVLSLRSSTSLRLLTSATLQSLSTTGKARNLTTAMTRGEVRLLRCDVSRESLPKNGYLFFSTDFLTHPEMEKLLRPFVTHLTGDKLHN